MFERGKRSAARGFVLAVLVVSTAACAVQAPVPATVVGPESGAQEGTAVLVFTRTEGFRHDSIPVGVARLKELLPTYGYSADHTEDPEVFTPDNLARYRAVVFLHTTGDVLDEAQQAALEAYVAGGGGFAGIHSAADTEHDWPWYGDLVGGFFTRHPLPAGVRVTLEDKSSLATAATPWSFSLFEEIYDFDRNPREDPATTVLATLVPEISPCEMLGQGIVGPLCELTRFPGNWHMGPDHPLAWQKEFGGGRSFYTNLGHMQTTWRRPEFLNHVVGGIRWAAGEADRFRATTIADGLDTPMRVEAAPDGAVYVIEREGDLVEVTPEQGRARTVGHLDVNAHGEQGLLGLALDPGFGANRTLYLYFVEGEESPTGVLASFRLDGAGLLDPSSRTDLLTVPQDGDGHGGGALAVDTDGNLLVGIGDNTTPFESNGYAPIDDRPGHEDANALRTSANPHDLRGKVLRVRPDGTVPAGNLFAPGEGLPEIWAMGMRNPFSVAAGPAGVFSGDVGPDAILGGSYGPRGRDELNRLETGDFGWPRCIGDREPYRQRDFATGSVGEPFDCTATVPPALSYDYITLSEWAVGTGGRAIMAGEVVSPDHLGLPYSLPDRFDGRLLAMDWVRGNLFAVGFGTDGRADSTERLAPDVDLGSPSDLDIGPDGALHVVDLVGGRVVRLEYEQAGRHRPSSRITAEDTASPDVPWATRIPALVEAGDAADPVSAVHWEVDGTEVPGGDATGLDVTFPSAGPHEVRLWAESSTGRRSLPHTVRFVAGNEPPSIDLTRFPDGVPRHGDTLTWTATIDDTAPDPTACDRVDWQLYLVHNTHSHPLDAAAGCTLTHVADLSGHETTPGANLSLALRVTYTDLGPSGTPEDGLTVQARDEVPFTSRTQAQVALATLQGLVDAGAAFQQAVPHVNWFELVRQLEEGELAFDLTRLGY